MPVYNGGDYLQSAVNSILAQSYRNIELILIDDHSNDAAIKRLDKTDERLSIFKNQGQGIVDALNLGINRAGFSFIARMDADDIALPLRIETQINYLLKNPGIHICATQVDIFRDDHQLGGGYKYYQDWINQLTDSESIANSIFIESPIPHPTAMLKKSDLLELSGYDDSPWPEDYDLWLRAYCKGFKFGKPDGILLRWRDHDNRLSRQSTRYDKKSFFKAKAFYLCRKYTKRNFRIWGSGPTGVLLHDEIINNNGSVKDFIDIAPNRIGRTKRDKVITDAYQLQKTDDLILIAVSARGARQEIMDFLDQHEFLEAKNYLCLA